MNSKKLHMLLVLFIVFLVAAIAGTFWMLASSPNPQVHGTSEPGKSMLDSLAPGVYRSANCLITDDFGLEGDFKIIKDNPKDAKQWIWQVVSALKEDPNAKCPSVGNAVHVEIRGDEINYMGGRFNEKMIIYLFIEQEGDVTRAYYGRY